MQLSPDSPEVKLEAADIEQVGLSIENLKPESRVRVIRSIIDRYGIKLRPTRANTAKTGHCTCHERDSSYTCDYCKSLGQYGRMERLPDSKPILRREDLLNPHAEEAIYVGPKPADQKDTSHSHD